MLDQLVSEAGIDLRVTRREFRLALEQGCGICVQFYEAFHGSRLLKPKLKNFYVFDNEDPANDDTELVRNYHASTNSEGGPYDVEELRVTPLGAKERRNWGTIFELYADEGKMFSLSLKPFSLLDRLQWTNTNVH